MSKLFTPITIKNMELKNRVVMPPMCMYSAEEDGMITPWHATHYHSRAVGGVGLIIMEATAVQQVGKISDADLGIWSDEHIDGLSQVVSLCHSAEGKIGVQLAHAGKKALNSSGTPLAPSALRFSDEYQTPKEVTAKEISEVVAAFGQGARRAGEAGFDTIEVHGAHGYLINEFLSPLTNKRTDIYGGPKENRFNFLREVLLEVKKYWPSEKPLLLRISAEEYAKGGNTMEEMCYFVNEAKKLGVDLINVSSGGVVSTRMHTYPGYQVQFSQKIKEACDILTIAGGLISSYELAEEIIENKRGDLVYMGRELLRNPYWPIHAALKKGISVQWPSQYERSK